MLYWLGSTLSSTLTQLVGRPEVAVGKLLAAVGISVVAAVIGVVMLVTAVLATFLGMPGPSVPFADLAPSSSALADIPPAYLQAFRAAAATCPGLPWSVLAGIGRVETDFGAETQISTAGAEGPMQFEPATFAAYDQPIPPGGAIPATPFDPTDAIYAAARMLCANGGLRGVDIPAAVFAYNHSWNYVAEVLSDAAAFAAPALHATAPTRRAARAVSYALAQVGTPYRWGGETAGVGFDCSGLTQAAYAAAGTAIPRTSEAQWSALPHVPLDEMQPGDLVFFDLGEFIPGLPGHVGIYIGHGSMVDAPHLGTTVRVESLTGWPTPSGVARPT